jgi:azurin
MYRQWLATVLIAAAPVALAAQSSPSAQKPTTEKPAATTQKPAGQKPDAAAKGAAASKGVRTIDIVGTDDMKFSVTTIEAKPGEQIRVRLMAKGGMPKIAMAHNFVLLAKEANTLKFVNASAMARATDFIPPEMKKDVIAATALAGAGETVEVTFKVPAAAGTYTYLCSFPGHFQAGMAGKLIVK